MLGTFPLWTCPCSFANLFKTLGPSPTFRIGGALTEELISAPTEETWSGVMALKEVANASFVIQIPTFYNKWRTIGREMMEQAKSKLGSHLVIFELGNEPQNCELFAWWTVHPVVH